MLQQVGDPVVQSPGQSRFDVQRLPPGEHVDTDVVPARHEPRPGTKSLGGRLQSVTERVPARHAVEPGTARWQ